MSRPIGLPTLAVIGMLACLAKAADRERPCHPPEGGTLGTLCGFADPEDVEAVEEAGVLLVSEEGESAPEGGGAIAGVAMPRGAEPIEPPFRLWPPEAPDAERGADGGLRFGDPSCPPPAALARFSPHGLTSRRSEAGTRLVAVVRHGEREAIEFFELRGKGRSAALRWVGCVRLPDDAAGNDAAFTPNGELVVTNYLPTVSGFRSFAYQVGAGLGMETGDVLAWSASSGWRHLPHSAGAMPNGIAVSPDGAFLYVAEVGTRSLYRVHADGSEARETVARFDGHPDNLAWSPSGTLLVALLRGDPNGSLWCRAPLPGCRSPWSLLEVDPRDFGAIERFRHDGSAIHSVTSAARMGPWTFFGSMADDRIGILLGPTDAETPH